jgi:hypothetical protein
MYDAEYYCKILAFDHAEFEVLYLLGYNAV